VANLLSSLQDIGANINDMLDFLCEHLGLCFLTFFGFVHPCSQLPHTHAPHCECIATMTNNRSSLLDNSICSTLITVCFVPCSKLVTILKLGNWFDYKLTFAKRFLSFITTCVIWKEEWRRGVLLADSFTTDGENFTTCTKILSVQGCSQRMFSGVVK